MPFRAPDLQHGSFSQGDNAPISLVDLPGVVKVTVENQLDPGVYEVGNNLGEALTLRYTGSGTPALVTVTMSGADAFTLAATVTGASSDDFSLDLTKTQFDTLAKVVNYIEALPNWTASLKAPADTPSIELDQVTALEAKLDAAAALQLMRIADSIVKWAENSRYISFAVQNNSPVAPANVAYTTFSNGSDGTENAAAWTAALAALAPEQDVLIVVPATGNVSYQVLAMEHVRNRLDLDGLRQRLFAGSDEGDTVQEAIDAATTFASRRANFCYPGVKRTGPDGTPVTYGGWAVAAMAAGLTVGLARRRSIANIPLLVAGVEKKLAKSEMDQLILGGVSPVHTISGQGTFIKKAVTTQTGGETFWQQQTNVAIADFIVTDLEADLNATYIQQLITATLLEGIRASVASKLQSYAESGLLFQDENAPAFKNIRVRAQGSVVRVDFEAAVAQPADLILLTAYLTEGQSAAA